MSFKVDKREGSEIKNRLESLARKKGVKGDVRCDAIEKEGGGGGGEVEDEARCKQVGSNFPGVYTWPSADGDKISVAHHGSLRVVS
jgi:hypothetical protein